MLRPLSLTAALAAALCAAMPAAAHDRLPAALAGLSPADFAADIRIEDDPQASAVVVSTQDGYPRGRSLKGALADDVHLRAVIDRATGQATWQVWHEIAYVDGRRDVQAVHYAAGGAAREARPFHVAHRADRCPPTDGLGHCGTATRIGFELPESTVREIAASHVPGSRAAWPLRFRATGGRDVTGGLAPAEAAGILRAVDTFRQAER